MALLIGLDISYLYKTLSNILFNKSQKFVEKFNTEDNNDKDSDLTPTWIDDDDENFGANIIPNNKSKSVYTEKLVQKYETLMGTPSWAKLNKHVTADEENDEILRTVGHLHKKNNNTLPKDFLEIKILQQINHDTKNEGTVIKCIEFHPKISAALVGGKSGVVSLFSIGGDHNDKLHSFELENWQITAAQFTPDGTDAFIASKSKHSYCVYNLATATPTLVQLPQIAKSANIFQLSNDGKYIATSDGYEEVHLISASSKELLKTFKHNTNIVCVTFNYDSTELFCCGTQGEITVWDLSIYRPMKKIYDHGCVTASCLSISPCGKLLATGSGEGIVNIYQTENLTVSEPIPYKVISNLKTKITNLKFNATTEILSVSSAYYPNAVKLVHIPSFCVFSNFPIPTRNLHNVNTVTFSPNGGYMALGNNKGSACLFRLKYYKNY